MNNLDLNIDIARRSAGTVSFKLMANALGSRLILSYTNGNLLLLATSGEVSTRSSACVNLLHLVFPISWLLGGAAALLGELAYNRSGFVVEVSYSSIIIRWLCLFVADYWQWFKAVPRLFRWFSGKFR